MSSTAMILDPSQQAALDAMQAGQSVFLTGAAGTGKSAVTTAFIGQSFRSVDVTATTGVAALNLRDQFRARAGVSLPVSTVYRWAGMGLGPNPGESNEDCWRRLQKGAGFTQLARWRRVASAECLVIDEVSMLPGRVLSFLDFLCRELRSSRSPFGGLQVVAVGDFLQLPPVSRAGGYDWAFAAPAWQGLRAVRLSKIHRQADTAFADLLNAVRVGRVTREHSATLATRVARFPKSSMLRLFTHNVQVDKWNGMQLDGLPGDATTFNADVEDGPCLQFIRSGMLTPEELALKVGARVMVTVNLTDPNNTKRLRLVNGSLGTVTGWDGERVLIRTDEDADEYVERFTWAGNADDGAGSITQFPLRLAWACTIHKSQGLTLPEALIDARAARDPGQAYVALSRVKSLAGLHLRDMFTGVFVSDEAIRYMEGIES